MADYIKKYWESQGLVHGNSHWASWGDNWMIELEIEAIGSHIKKDSVVIDIGCANGFATFRQLNERRPAKIVGVDYAENMIASAIAEAEEQVCGESEIKFEVGDIRSLNFENNSFDLAYTTRVLINLPTWEEQVKGINECLRIVKPGGKVILSEGFWEPLCLLNSMRIINSLPPLVEHDFNRYLKKSILEKYLKSLGVSYQINDFSSIYYLGSRLVRELVTDVNAYDGFSNPINKLFFEIEKSYSGGGFGIQQAVIITK